jgi:hypothetical protein
MSNTDITDLLRLLIRRSVRIWHRVADREYPLIGFHDVLCALGAGAVHRATSAIAKNDSARSSASPEYRTGNGD